MKKIFTLFALLLCMVAANAQSYEWYVNNASAVNKPEGFFTISTLDLNAKYTGKFKNLAGETITCNKGQKISSSTEISWTASRAFTLIIVQSLSETSLVTDPKLDGTALSGGVENPSGYTTARVYTIENVGAGSHKITRGSGEEGLMYVAVVLNEVSSNSAPISWSASNVEFKVRDNISGIVLPTLSNEENLDVTYASSDPDIASIDANGKVTLQNETVGSTTISATYNGDKYDETVAVYEINVVTNIVDTYDWAPFDADPNFVFDHIWKATTSNIAANTSIINDENVNVSTVYAANANKNYKGNFFGVSFDSSTQIGRVGAAPSAENLTGTEQSGSTPLVVEAYTDLQLVIIFRKQAVETEMTASDNEADNVITNLHFMGSYPNDNKSLFAANQDNVTEKLDQTIYTGGAYDGKAHATNSNDYLYAAACWDLKSGEKYTIWGTGSTICVNGIGYILPSEPDTEAVKGLDVDANAPVEFFNLQGVRVANPENGIFIRRQGNNVSKVLVK